MAKLCPRTHYPHALGVGTWVGHLQRIHFFFSKECDEDAELLNFEVLSGCGLLLWLPYLYCRSDVVTWQRFFGAEMPGAFGAFGPFAKVIVEEPFWDSCGHSSVGASTPLREVSRVSRLEKHEKSCKSAKRSLQILGDAFSRRWKKSNRCVFLFLFFENLSDQINALEKRFANGEVSVCSDFRSNFLQALMQKRDSDPLESRVSERRFLK